MAIELDEKKDEYDARTVISLVIFSIIFGYFLGRKSGGSYTPDYAKSYEVAGIRDRLTYMEAHMQAQRDVRHQEERRVNA